MNDTTYNGWTNYATWRVNLEMFDGVTLNQFYSKDDAYTLGQEMKDYAEEILSMDSNGVVLDYALAFLSDVNWTEYDK